MTSIFFFSTLFSKLFLISGCFKVGIVWQSQVGSNERVENTVGKRRKYWLPAFSSFPKTFSIGFIPLGS